MKLYLTIVALALLCAWPCHALITGYSRVIASGDSCTGNLLYSHHAENSDDATTSANGTQGCSASETYKSWVKTSAVYDNTSGYYGDGAYSLKSNGYNHRATLTTTGWMDIASKGSVSMWYRGNGGNDSTLVDIYIDATHYITASYYFSTGVIRLAYRDGTAAPYVNSAVTLPTTGGWLQVGWDASTDLLQVRTCGDEACSGESWTTKTDTSFVSIGTMPSTITVNGKSGASNYGWGDNVKIFSSSNCTQ